MRIFWTSAVFFILMLVIGCGSNGPVEPAKVTPEMERQAQEAQRKVDAAERQQMAKEGANRPLSQEQNVEMQERGQQRFRR